MTMFNCVKSFFAVIGIGAIICAIVIAPSFLKYYDELDILSTSSTWYVSDQSDRSVDDTVYMMHVVHDAQEVYELPGERGTWVTVSEQRKEELMEQNYRRCITHCFVS